MATIKNLNLKKKWQEAKAKVGAIEDYNVGAEHWQNIWIKKNYDVKAANKHNDANDTQKTPFWRVENVRPSKIHNLSML